MRVASLFLLLSTFIVSSCFNPDLSGEPKLHCTVGGAPCPGDYTCDPVKKVCVKKGTPSPDAGKADAKADVRTADVSTADAPPPGLTCSLRGTSQTIASEVQGTFGAAYDASKRLIYLSYIAGQPASGRAVTVKAVNADLKTIKTLSTKAIADFGKATAIDARDGNWAVVYQRKTVAGGQTEQLYAITSANSTSPFWISNGALAGLRPSVLILPSSPSSPSSPMELVVAHGRQSSLAGSHLEAAVYRVKDLAAELPNKPTITTITLPSAITDLKASGLYSNDLALGIPQHPKAVVYGTYGFTKTSTTLDPPVNRAIFIVGLLGTPNIRTALFDKFFSTSTSVSPGLDIADGGDAAFARNPANRKAEIAYVAVKSGTSTPAEKISFPSPIGQARIAKANTILATLGINDTRHVFFAARDTSKANSPWKTASTASTIKATFARLIAVPDSADKNKVAFHIIYRSTTPPSSRRSLFRRSTAPSTRSVT